MYFIVSYITHVQIIVKQFCHLFPQSLHYFHFIHILSKMLLLIKWTESMLINLLADIFELLSIQVYSLKLHED